MSYLTQKFLGTLANALPDSTKKQKGDSSILFLAAGAGALIFGIAGLVLVAFNAPDMGTFWRTLGAGLIGLMGATAAGAFLGFLFGIPRVDRSSNPSGKDDPAAQSKNARPIGVRQSDNLEQVADWLTKTIVGVTLIEWKPFLQSFKELSSAVTVEILGFTTGYAPGALFLTLFGAVGFLLCYVWAKRYWIGELQGVEFESTTMTDGKDFGLRSTLSDATQNKAHPGSLLGALSVDFIRLDGPPPVSPSADANDPWKGRFGGAAIDQKMGRQLLVGFERDPTDKGFVILQILVKALDGARVLDGSVRFYLHPTFPKPIRDVPVINGKAIVEVRAYGGNFTVGAQTDAGACSLEATVAALAPDWVGAEWKST